MVKVFIVEGHNIVRDAIRSLLEKEPGLQVVEVAQQGIEAIKKISEGFHADIVLAALEGSDFSMLDFLEQIRAIAPDLKVIFLSNHTDQLLVMRAVQAGTDGYLFKDVGREELLFAIKHIAAGGRYISADLSIKMLLNLSSESTPLAQVELSKREAEVLSLIAEGLTNNEIANKLFTSRRTVEGHRQKLLNKTNTRNTAALIRFAILNKLVK